MSTDYAIRNLNESEVFALHDRVADLCRSQGLNGDAHIAKVFRLLLELIDDERDALATRHANLKLV